MIVLDLWLPDFTDRSNDKWCVSIGKGNREPILYENYWSDNEHYVCQYDCELLALCNNNDNNNRKLFVVDKPQQTQKW